MLDMEMITDFEYIEFTEPYYFQSDDYALFADAMMMTLFGCLYKGIA